MHARNTRPSAVSYTLGSAPRGELWQRLMVNIIKRLKFRKRVMFHPFNLCENKGRDEKVHLSHSFYFFLERFNRLKYHSVLGRVVSSKWIAVCKGNQASIQRFPARKWWCPRSLQYTRKDVTGLCVKAAWDLRCLCSPRGPRTVINSVT